MRGFGVVLGCGRRLVGVAVLMGVFVAAPANANATPPPAGLSPGTALNVALTGSASASTEASGSPAANAIDGDASSEWCANQWTGTLTVDLGSPHRLSGLGVTLGATTTTALVNLSHATSDGTWQPVPGAQQQSVPAAEPVYWPSERRLPGRAVRPHRNNR